MKERSYKIVNDTIENDLIRAYVDHDVSEQLDKRVICVTIKRLCDNGQDAWVEVGFSDDNSVMDIVGDCLEFCSDLEIASSARASWLLANEPMGGW